MACEHVTYPGGGGGFVCTTGRRRRRAAPCDFCRAEHAFLCDAERAPGKTCDAKLCPAHATVVGEDRHLCAVHARAAAPSNEGKKHEAEPERNPAAQEDRLWPEQVRAWEAVAAECPAGAGADAHRAGEQPLIHTSEIGGGAVRCCRGQRRADFRAYFHPEGGLLPTERTTDRYRFAELAGRLERLPPARAAAPAGIVQAQAAPAPAQPAARQLELVPRRAS